VEFHLEQEMLDHQEGEIPLLEKRVGVHQELEILDPPVEVEVEEEIEAHPKLGM